MNDTTPAVELSDVIKRYPSPGGELEVLSGASLSVAPGESLAVVGPSGCGKSTLLNLIAALDTPSGGTVRVDGRDVAAMGQREQAAFRNRTIGLVFQLHHLLPQLTVWENVLAPTLAGPADGDAEDRARALLERVGLGERADHRPGQLSGGEAQRVAVVRALINRPAILLADEPTGSLDRRASDGLADLLGELNRDEGVTLITVTHSTRLAGRMLRSVELRDGRIVGPDEK